MTNTLKEMAELRAKATDGPWEEMEHCADEAYIEAEGDAILVFSWLREEDHVVVPYDNVDNNAAFIAAAGNFDFAQEAADKAALEEENKRLRGTVRDRDSQIEHLWSMLDELFSFLPYACRTVLHELDVAFLEQRARKALENSNDD